MPAATVQTCFQVCVARDILHSKLPGQRTCLALQLHTTLWESLRLSISAVCFRRFPTKLPGTFGDCLCLWRRSPNNLTAVLGFPFLVVTSHLRPNNVLEGARC